MIIDLGLIDYEDCYKIQRDMVQRRKLCEIDDTLILAEHNSVFTIGRSGRKDNLVVDENYLCARGIKVLNVDRGGDITFHGKGQLVVYPIVLLKDKWRDLHAYMYNLESVAIKLIDRYLLNPERCIGRTGVWVSGKKVASIGVGVSNWVTYHGLSININLDLEFFNMIYPCGMRDVKMTSLSQLIGKDISVEDIKDCVVSDFENVFNFGGVDFAPTEAPEMKS